MKELNKAQGDIEKNLNNMKRREFKYEKYTRG